LDTQSRAWLRDARGDLWVISFNPEFGPEVVAAERGVPESHMGPVNVTAEMVKAGQDQWRLDSSCLLNGPQRIERMLRAALTGGTDRALFDESIRGL
jgi:hypothetical protein